ncbi:MAG: hypothetical protein WC710_13645 [Gallionella sp.]|jgi:hypothetical protein
MRQPRDGRDGYDGLNGIDGQSAYRIAVKNGFVGTEFEWIKSLRGADGRDGKDGIAGLQGDRGFTGLNGTDGRDGVDGAKGADGRNGIDGKQGIRGLAGKAGADGKDGNQGFDGWSPLLAVVPDRERRVHQVTGWTGGEGAEPESGFYLGKDGPVEKIADATDIRGAQGTTTVVVRSLSGDASASNIITSVNAQTGDVVLGAADVGADPAGASAAVAAAEQALRVLVQDPTGFPNRTDSAISFVEATRTFSIQPTGASYDVYAAGVQFTKSGVESIVIPDVTGAAFIYFNEATGTISQTATFDIALIESHIWIAAVYWNATQQLAVLVGDERHGLAMDHATHRHLHQSFGTTWVTGLALTNILTDQSGALATHAQCGVQDGQINDEDIAHTIVDGVPQDISAVLKAPIIWQIGSEWRIAAVADYPLLYSGRPGTSYTGANGRPAYNSGGVLTQVQNGHYVLAHILATNDTRYPVIAVCGRADYSTVVNARAAAYTELLSLTGLPFTEFKPLGSLIFEASSSYANVPKARVRTTDEGGAYIDLRRNLSLGASGAAATDVQREVFRIEDPAGALPTVTYPAIAFQATGVANQYRMHLLP